MVGARPGRFGLVVGVVVLAAGCTGDDPDVTAAPTAETAAPVVTAATVAPVASDLAPSQTAASTIAPPALPPPCSADQLVFAQGASSEPGVVFVDITNTGDAWCEADLSASVAVAPEMEPDVWIDPGATAQLRVEIDAASCTTTGPVDSIGLDVNGEPVAVPVDRIDVCAIALTALYPVD